MSEPHIRALNSRIVYENKWMTVREDDVVMAEGSTGVFGVVEKPDFALVVPFDGHGFYVVAQYRYPVDARYLEFPQGSWEEVAAGDPVDLARGELAEETGLRAGTMTYLGTSSRRTASAIKVSMSCSQPTSRTRAVSDERRGRSSCHLLDDRRVPRVRTRGVGQGRTDARRVHSDAALKRGQR